MLTPKRAAKTLLFAFTLGATVSASGRCATNLSGNLSGTLDAAGSPYLVTGNIRIQTGQSLVIQPGVVLKMGANLGFLIEGTLTAVAPASQPIVITSYRDDSAGGDTNGDGSATQPARGDWGEVFINGSGASGSVMDGVTVRYGGGQNGGVGSRANVYIANAAPTLTRCDISNSSYYGLHAAEPGLALTLANNNFHDNGLVGVRAGAQVTVTNNVFDNQQLAIWFGGPQGRLTFSGNTFTRTQNLYLESYVVSPQDGGGNSFAAGMSIFVPTGSGNIGTPNSILTADAIWDVTAIPYVVGHGLFSVNPGVKLTVAPGVLVKFTNNLPSSNAAMLQIDGTLDAQGTAAAPIFFTSAKDDSVGGDTNFDGNTTQPGPGDWPGIFVRGNAAAILAYAKVRYAGFPNGSGASANVSCQNSAPILTHCELSDSLSAGFTSRLNCAPTVTQSDLHHNAQYGFFNDGGAAPSIKQNAFRSNGTFGLLNGAAGTPLDATLNYWGSSTGPRHVSNPAGTGDAVSNDVTFVPFLTSSSTSPVNPPPPPTGAPTVNSVVFTPPPPIGLGTFTLDIQFSAPMDNTVAPQVSFQPQGGTPVTISMTRYVGATWTGRATITTAMPPGAAALTVSGAKNPGGLTMLPSTSTFQISYVQPGVPTGLSAAPNTSGGLDLSWQAPAGSAAASSFNLYRSTYALPSRVGVTPLKKGLSVPSVADLPPANVAAFYYAVTAIDSQGVESSLSNVVAVPLPLSPVISSPQDGDNVDASSVVPRGFAQPGTVVEVRLAGSTNLLASATPGAQGDFAVPLTLGLGSVQLSFVSRAPAISLSSLPVILSLNVINFPAAPGNFAATPGDTVVDLTWTASPTPGVTGYNVYRDGGQVPLNAQPLSAGQTTFRDLALTNGRSYSYLMTSIGTSGQESLPTNSVTSTPQAGAGW